MTVLSKYQRLEAPGVWRADPASQRRDVIVSLGDATLTISDQRGMALAHWSLPATVCTSAHDARPAIYRPALDAPESIEIDDATMIDALDRVRGAIERAKPHPGRLRMLITVGLSVAVLGLGLFWLPNALIQTTTKVVPAAKRAEIGEALLARIRRVAGAPCDTPSGARALAKLQTRLLPAGQHRIVVVSGSIKAAAHLPGGIVLLNRALVEDYEDPAVAAGFILAEDERARTTDPLESLLNEAGLRAALRLLTTGKLTESTLDHYAETLLTAPPIALPQDRLLLRFSQAELRVSPYAYALDITGEQTLNLIEADPISPTTEKIVLADGDWVALQGICGD